MQEFKEGEKILRHDIEGSDLGLGKHGWVE